MPWDPRIQALVDRHPSLRAVGNTPLVPVDLLRRELPDVEVFAKMESLNPGGSLKDRPVLRMLLSAVDDGRLKPDKTVLDSSSGNAGIAYAMIGRIIGVPVEIVIPDNASAERKKRMRAHGARLTFTDALLGYDEALREVRRRYEADPGHYFFCDQYSNQDNWRAHYETTAVEILEQTGGRVTHVVVGVGTGGTLTGLGRRLKEHDPAIRLVCVIPEAFPGCERLGEEAHGLEHSLVGNPSAGIHPHRERREAHLLAQREEPVSDRLGRAEHRVVGQHLVVRDLGETVGSRRARLGDLRRRAV